MSQQNKGRGRSAGPRPQHDENRDRATSDAGAEEISVRPLPIDSVEETFRRDEGDPLAWYGLGFVLHGEGDLVGAEDAYRRGIDLDEGNAQIWFNLGNVLSDAGRPSECVKAFRRSIALDANDHEVWNNLGAALCDCDALRDAVACFETALALRPDYHPAWNNLGTALETGNDDLAGAVEAYRRAIALCDDRAHYHLNLASALCRLDREEEGARYLENALAIDPSLRSVVSASSEFDAFHERRESAGSSRGKA